MAEKDNGVLSPTGDALLLTGLFLPFAPIMANLYIYLIAQALGCPADPAQACGFAGLDFNHLESRAADMLTWSAKASRSGAVLLVYMALLASVAQFTVRGFRGRVVRTCAIIMWAGIMPLVLSLAAVISHAPEQMCGIGPCDAGTLLTSLALYGNIFSQWLADIAVPLAVLVTALLALTLGYRALVGRLVQLATGRN